MKKLRIAVIVDMIKILSAVYHSAESGREVLL